MEWLVAATTRKYFILFPKEIFDSGLHGAKLTEFCTSWERGWSKLWCLRDFISCSNRAFREFFGDNESFRAIRLIKFPSILGQDSPNDVISSQEAS